MAENTRIVTIQVNTTEAVKGIATYQSKIQDLADEEKRLKDAIARRVKEHGDAGKATQEEQQRLAAIKEEQKAYRNVIAGLSKEVQNNIKIDQEQQGSLKQLRAELSNSTAQYDKMSQAERESAKGVDLKEHIAATTESLKQAEQALGNFHRNVGNYPGAIDDLKGELQGLIAKMKEMKVSGQSNSQNYAEMSQRAEELKKALTDVGVAVKDLGINNQSLKQELKSLNIAMAEMKLAGQDTTQKYAEMAQRAGQLKDAISDVSEQTKRLASDTKGFDSLTSAASTLTAAWTLFNSTIGATTQDSAKMQEMMKKLQIGLTALAALTTLQNNLQKQSAMMLAITDIQHKANAASIALESAAQSKNVVVMGLAKAAQAALNLVAAANPYVLLALAIASVVGALVLLSSQSKKSAADLKALNEIAGAARQTLGQMGKDINFDVKLAEAAGKGKKEILAIEREGARKMLEEADKAYDAYVAIYINASNKVKKEMKEHLDELMQLQKDAADKLNELNNEASALEISSKREAGEKAVDAAKTAKENEIEAVRKAEDMLNEAIKDSATKAAAIEETRHKRSIEDLQKMLNQRGQTPAYYSAINKQIQQENKDHETNMQKLTAESLANQIKEEEKTLQLKLEGVKKGSDEEFKLKQQLLWAQRDMELSETTLTEEQKQAIKDKYALQDSELQAQRQQEESDKRMQAIDEEFALRIAQAESEGQDTLMLQAMQKQAEYDAMTQMEDESDAAFAERKLQKGNEIAEIDSQIAAKEIEIEASKQEAMANLKNAGMGLLNELAKTNKAAAIASKAITLGEIAVQTGKVLAVGIAQATAIGYPQNPVAIATTVATVLANITTAIKTVKGAKFATGGLVTGAGTGTSDSIAARLSNGESVNTERATSMFAPIYSALNQLGGGVPISAAQTGPQAQGEEMIAAAVAKGVSALNLRIGVDEITRVQSRVATLESVGDV